MAKRRRGKSRHRSKRGRHPRRVLGWSLTLFLLITVVVPVGLVGLFKWVDPPISAYMLQHRSELRQTDPNASIHYRWVDYERISPAMRLAVIAAEDQKFPRHNGFDWASIRQAARDNLRGRRLRGGSTISQQAAKNLFLWNQRSYLRKAVEAWFTVLIEALWSKQRILEIYLNIAQFEQAIFGVEAGARHHFQVSATDLDFTQAALLAAVLPSPERYEAADPSDYVFDRQIWILEQMGQLGLGYLSSIERQ